MYDLTIWALSFHPISKNGGGSLLEKCTKFYNQFFIQKLDDLLKLDVTKIVHADLTNNLPPKLFRFFTLTKTSLFLPPEQMKLHAITYIFPDIQLPDYNNALISKSNNLE